MYKINKEAFGTYDSICLTNESGTDFIRIIPAVGACLTQVRLNNIEVLDGYQTDKELDVFGLSKSGVLVPFPNRLLDGRFTWKNKSYQFPLNELANQHAIHGFVRKAPMEVCRENTNKDKALVSCKYNYDGKQDYFPFSFQLVISFQLSKSGLEVSIQVKNVGDESFPIGIGWHPYFKLDGKVDELLLKMPKASLIAVDDRMIPTGKRKSYSEFDQLTNIGDTVLDSCFELEQKEGRAVLLLQNKSHQLQYWQEAGDGNFPFIQVFTPAHRDSIAVEPMSCNVNAFNNGQGLVVLEVGESLEAKCGVSLENC